ncbi:MAG TPA: lysylphosphatidylglycerol synthase transmembrane domain-containing protein, partial [Ktedonobacterales bacterium]|nr:lysylphosphatidylglycerol synthase transmembrane domain-containing protein [Ktedonobacterales bacterium]
DQGAERLASSQQQPGARRGKRWLKRALGLIVVAVILALLGRNLASSWNTLSTYHWQASAPLLALAFAGFVVQTLSYPLVWRLVLRRLGYALPLSKSVRIYLASEFVRYLPGNVWHVITRILWAEREGIPKPIGFISMTVELVTKIASAALVFAVTLLFWPRIDVLGSAIGGQTIVLIGLAAIPVVLGLMQPRLLAWLLNRALSFMRKPAITLPMRYRDVLLAVFCWCGSWAIGGAAFYLLVMGVAGSGAASWSLLTLALSIGIASLGWDIGFLSFITPSGLGFREAAVALLLTLSAVIPGIALATVIAFLWRILSTLAELLCVGGAHLIVTRMERGRKAEPTTGYPQEVGALVD